MIGFNFLGLAPDQLSGIGRYSVSLIEEVVASIGEKASEQIVVFVPAGSERHFADEVLGCVRPLRMPKGAMARIAYEQTIFPFMVRRAKVTTLLNAAFTGPLWGVRNMVTVVHDLFYRVVPQMVRPDRRLYLRLLTPPTLRRSRAIIAVSQNTAADIARYYPDIADRIVAIPLANRTLRKPAAAGAGEGEGAPDRALMVSTITANKNPDAFVAALKAIRATRDWGSGIIVGNDPEGIAAAAVARLGAEAFVELRSHVSDEKLAELYATSLAVVVPSFYEGFGLPILEAQAAGAPVICSDRGSLPEVAGDAALFFSPDNPEQLAAALISVHDDDRKRAEMIAAGFRNVSRYSWRRTAEETLDVLKS